LVTVRAHAMIAGEGARQPKGGENAAVEIAEDQVQRLAHRS